MANFIVEILVVLVTSDLAVNQLPSSFWDSLSIWLLVDAIIKLKKQ